MARRRIRSAEQAVKYLNYLINSLENGKIDPSICGKLGYLTSLLIKGVEITDVEKRLEALENAGNNPSGLRIAQ